MADHLPDGMKEVESERKGCFGGRSEDELRWGTTWILRFVMDPLLMRDIQEFSI